ncbi:hypothetical protein ABZX60_13415 [Streptomyces olivaceus]|uniref:hypothetical protein n=1 Tax=Streptomyces olivaceus TaxID=47716 RepID=UPI0033A29361
MTSDGGWSDLKEMLPVGMLVTGEVVDVRSFGVIFRIAEYPDVVAVADTISILWRDDIALREKWPTKGDVLAASIVGHTEHNRQIKLRLHCDGLPDQ